MTSVSSMQLTPCGPPMQGTTTISTVTEGTVTTIASQQVTVVTSGPSLTVPGSPSQQVLSPAQQGARVLPLVPIYIQGPPAMRVSDATTTTMAIAATQSVAQPKLANMVNPVTQIVSATRPALVTTSTQFVPTLAAKVSGTSVAPTPTTTAIRPGISATQVVASVPPVAVTSTKSTMVSAAPSHFVIQAPRPAGPMTMVQGGQMMAAMNAVPVGAVPSSKHTYTYLGTIIKGGNKVETPAVSQQLVLTAPAPPLRPTLPAGLMSTNQKVLLAPVPASLSVLPQLSPAPNPSTTVGNAVPQKMVTVQQPTSQGTLLVPMAIPTQVAGKGNMINLKISNGQIQADGKGSINVLREAKPMVGSMSQLPPLQPISKHTLQKCTSSKAANGIVVQETPQPTMKDVSTSVIIKPEGKCHEEIYITTTNNCNMTTNNGNNSVMNNNNNNNNSANNNEVQAIVDDKRRRNQDLNKCLQEAVDAIFAGDDMPDTFSSKSAIKCHSVDEAPPTVEEVKEEPKDAKVEFVNGDLSVLETEATNGEMLKDIPNLVDLSQVAVDDFDPMKVLEWKDGIGALPGSNLKFRLNEFGIMEIVDDNYEKLLASKPSAPVAEVKSEPDAVKNRKSEELDTKEIATVKDEAIPEDGIKKESEIKSDNVPEDLTKTTHHSGKSTRLAAGLKSLKPRSADDIYCCEGCGCYGLASEFVTPRFCSHTCVTSYNNKKAAQSKKERELKELRARRKKKRLYLLGLQENSNQVSPSLKENTPTPSEEDTTSNEASQDANKAKFSWLTGKNGFSWTKYLEHCKAKAAPQKLFKDPFPYSKNGFKVGMKLEGIDPEHPSMFCILTVAEVQGYRVRLHFDGFPENHDFWVNADSMDIFPAGWCEKNGHRLHAPRGYTAANFNWSNHLKQCKAQAAPRHLFANKTGSTICPNGFRLGMKLEAVDRKNSSLVCVATVAGLLDNRILVHFDSWDDIYDYWADPTSPYIHPVGWCESHGHTLTPPNGSKAPNKFSWEDYLKETKSVAVPARAFKQRPPSGFRKGMKLECVDKRVPFIIRVATVSDVKEHQIKIHFDGWPDDYDYWIDDDSCDIHPAGWCIKTGHPLEPPLTEEDLAEVDNSGCHTPGCRGFGHVKGSKYSTHHTDISCPYALQNLNNDNLLPDRIYSKPELYDCRNDAFTKERSCKPEGRIPESRPVGRPPKIRKVEAPEDSPVIPEQELPPEDDDMDNEEGRRRKRTRLLEDTSPCNIVKAPLSPVPQKIEPPDDNKLRQDVHQSIFNPGYQPNPDRYTPYCWTKHAKLLNTYISSRLPKANTWTQEDVVEFVKKIPGCEEKAKVFREEQIDGEAFLLLNQNDIVTLLGLKLGPAIKVYNSIVLLRQRVGGV